MPILILTFLAAVTSAFNTLPSNTARGEVTYALLHPVGDPKNCQAQWDGIDPTVSEWDVYVSSCALIYSPALSPSQQQTILGDLPNNCYPPTIPPTCGEGVGHAPVIRIKPTTKPDTTNFPARPHKT